MQVIQTVTWKSVSDRYTRLQEQFDQSGNANQRLSDVGGEMGEMEEPLMAMREVGNDLGVHKTAKKTAQQGTDRQKEMIG